MIQPMDECVGLASDARFRRVHVRHVEQLNLADHDGRGAAGLEAARLTRKFGRKAACRDDARLFHDHRHGIDGAAIHHEILRHTHRQRIRADDVFDHVGGLVEREAGAQCGYIDVAQIEAAGALFNRQVTQLFWRLEIVGRPGGGD